MVSVPINCHQHAEANGGVYLLGLRQVVSNVLADLSRNDRHHSSIRVFHQTDLESGIARDVELSRADDRPHVELAVFIHRSRVGLGIRNVAANVPQWIGLRDYVSDWTIAVEMNGHLLKILDSA